MPERLSPPMLLDPAHLAAVMDMMRRRGVISFRLRSGDQEVEVHWPAPPTTPQARAEASEPSEHGSDDAQGTLHAILSPTVGTYFESSEPGRAPFVRVGDRVTAGQTVCVVESMKLMSEIASDVDGVVVDLPVPNGGSVKAGQLLGLIRLDGER